MAEIVEFDIIHEYSLYDIGITVDATLQNSDLSVDIDAKIDTGSTSCIFERHYGERLDLEIESGLPVTIGTATGTFKAFGHELTLSVLDIETV